MRDAIFNDLWGRDCYSFGNWVPNTEDEFFTSSNNDEMLGKSLDLIEE